MRTAPVQPVASRDRLSPSPSAQQAVSAKEGAEGRQTSRVKVAYVMSRFPKLSETFILYEMLALAQQGVQVELYPLLREREELVHPEARPLVERAHFQPFLSWRVLRSQLYFLRRRPRAYAGALWALLRGTWGSLNFLIGGLGVFPKVAHIARLMAAEGVTHVHCHFANHPAAAGFVIRRLTGIPYSFTAHGSDLHVDRRMLREKVAEAAFVVAISDYNRELIVEDCGESCREKLMVIHCGIDTEVFKPAERIEHDLGLTILCVGKLHEVKGQTYLIEACRLLAEAGLDVRCQLVGDGPDRARLSRQIVEAGLGERVSLLGSCTRGEVASLLRSAHALVAPSVPTRRGKREGIPVVLMEAMASGVPVVASGISGIPELVEDGCTGLLTPPRDSRALAQALQRLHDDPSLRRRLGLAGREKVVRDFDLSKSAAMLARHFTARTAS